MRVKAFLCLFLLFSAAADDGLAYTTPDPLDDILAAEDNEFIRSESPDTDQQVQDHARPAPRFTCACPGRAQGPMSRPAVGEAHRADSGPSLLYTLMSLQR
jgi:hypothetical protein